MAAEQARRAFLATASSALLAGLAGCPSTPSDSTTPDGSRGATLCTEPVTPPSSRSADGRMLVRDYPAVPEELTRESAEAYATDFE